MAFANANGVYAEGNNPVLSDTLTIKIGAIRNEVEGSVTVARAPLPPSALDLKKVLGINSRQTNPWGKIRWRFADRWTMNFQFDRYKQQGNRATPRNFNFAGEVFPEGTQLDFEYRVDVYRLDVAYDIWRGDRFQAGAGIGVHAVNTELNLDGTINVGDQSGSKKKASDNILAPLPNLRIFLVYGFTKHLALISSAGWLSLDDDEFDGDYTYANVNLDYRFSDRWGLGMGAQWTDIEFRHDSGDGDFEKTNNDLTGVFVYIIYGF